ncbi:tail completion protein gp17 [Gellertiella hungarica]|uniref:DUF3168 domain-containing protein n=1 Tax=Gellertiella hungarica TaxID=1572859 RepID=A0A7W6J9D4_9HYPH|nr:DUF3168 domain-containing protein [Gellertiella hungarica]MBB4067167.1 hypothetical protein [Gellertiella hungarica]
MLEPTLALQTAIRSALVASPEVTALVSPNRIRAGGTRPTETPCILMSDGNTVLHGRDYTAQRAAWVYLDLHVWTLKQGNDAAKAIAFAVANALDRIPTFSGCECDHFRITRTTFPRDPDPDYGHGVLSIEAFVRWVL